MSTGLCVTWVSFLVFPPTDFLQVRHSDEDNHLHQEQSVPGSAAVQRLGQRAAGQAGRERSARRAPSGGASSERGLFPSCFSARRWTARTSTIRAARCGSISPSWSTSTSSTTTTRVATTRGPSCPPATASPASTPPWPPPSARTPTPSSVRYQVHHFFLPSSFDPSDPWASAHGLIIS